MPTPSEAVQAYGDAWNELDESKLDPHLMRQIGKLDHLVVVDAPDDDRIDANRSQPLIAGQGHSA